MADRIDIILITYGEPDRNSFLKHWNYSRRILNRITRRVAPIPSFLIPMIAAYRGRRKRRLWENSGYRSAMASITEAQKNALQQTLATIKETLDWHVHVAYQFCAPTLFDQFQKILPNNSRTIVLIPMYVPRSDFTTGLCEEDVAVFLENIDKPGPVVKQIKWIYALDQLAEVMAAFVEKQMSAWGMNLKHASGRGLLLGAHGTVVSPIKGIRETGYEDTAALGASLTKRLANYFERISIAWLNHRRGGEWTSPSLEQAVTEMQKRGIERFVYFPFGFLADNEESVVTGKNILLSLGIAEYIHLPCINNDSAFIQFLGKVIIESLTV